MNVAAGLKWIPLVLLFTLGMSNAPLLPIWLPGAMQRFGLNPAQPGLIASLELACLAGSSILWASRRRVPGRDIWLVGAIVISIAANLLALTAPQVAVLVAARAAAGLSLGLILAEGTRRAATMPDPQRVFARQQLGLILFVAGFFATVPAAVAAYGPFVPFVYGAVLGLLALVSTIWLPRAAPSEGTPQAENGTATRTLVSSSAAAMALLAIALTYLTQNAIWTYITTAAALSATDLPALGRILAIGAFLNLAAPLTAVRLAASRGRPTALVIGYAGIFASVLLLTLGLGRVWFAVGAIGLNLFLMFVTPILLGILADLDSSGRTAAAGPAFFTIGAAIGPALAGLVIASAGMPMLGAILCAVVVAALTLAIAGGLRHARPASAGA